MRKIKRPTHHFVTFGYHNPGIFPVEIEYSPLVIHRIINHPVVFELIKIVFHSYEYELNPGNVDPFNFSVQIEGIQIGHS